MDAKEIKSTLKAAREAIRQKEFKEALRNCKVCMKYYQTVNHKSCKQSSSYMTHLNRNSVIFHLKMV